jgi:hypothetical protein
MLAVGALLATLLPALDADARVLRSPTAASATAKPEDGRYAGEVGVYRLSFEVTGGGTKIKHLESDFNPAAFCSIPTSESTIGFPTLSLRDGQFTGSATENPHAKSPTFFSIRGKFTSATHASGSIHAHFTITSLPPCQASGTFTVSRAR